MTKRTTTPKPKNMPPTSQVVAQQPEQPPPPADLPPTSIEKALQKQRTPRQRRAFLFRIALLVFVVAALLTLLILFAANVPPLASLIIALLVGIMAAALCGYIGFSRAVWRGEVPQGEMHYVKEQKFTANQAVIVRLLSEAEISPDRKVKLKIIETNHLFRSVDTITTSIAIEAKNNRAFVNAEFPLRLKLGVFGHITGDEIRDLMNLERSFGDEYAAKFRAIASDVLQRASYKHVFREGVSEDAEDFNWVRKQIHRVIEGKRTPDEDPIFRLIESSFSYLPTIPNDIGKIMSKGEAFIQILETQLSRLDLDDPDYMLKRALVIKNIEREGMKGMRVRGGISLPSAIPDDMIYRTEASPNPAHSTSAPTPSSSPLPPSLPSASDLFPTEERKKQLDKNVREQAEADAEHRRQAEEAARQQRAQETVEVGDGAEALSAYELKVRILYLEDETAYRKIVEKFNRKHLGYGFKSVNRIVDAFDELGRSTYLYHILLCDIDLSTNGEDDASGGIHFLEMLDFIDHLGGYAVVMLSRNTDRMRELFKKYPNKIVEFIPKDELQYPETMTQHLREAVETQTGINFKLRIGSEQDWGLFGDYIKRVWHPPETIIDDLSPIRVPDVSRSILEIEVVLRRLFYDYEQIGVETLWQPNLYRDIFLTTGMGKVKPEASVRSATTRQIVRVGTKRAVKKEVEQFEKFIEQKIAGTGINALHAESPWLMGIRYDLPDFGRLRHFRQYIREHNASAIKDQLLRLTRLVEAWYNPDMMKGTTEPLFEFYARYLGFTPDGTIEILSNIDAEIKQSPLTNTISLSRIHQYAPQSHAPHFVPCHGHLIAPNILVDVDSGNLGEGSMYLIDFAKTDYGHPYADWALLDADIRVNMLPENVSLDTYRQMERNLILGNEQRFSEKLITKLIDIITYLENDLYPNFLERRYDYVEREYRFVLLLHLIKMVANRNLQDYQRQRALISSSILLRALEIQ